MVIILYIISSVVMVLGLNRKESKMRMKTLTLRKMFLTLRRFIGIMMETYDMVSSENVNNVKIGYFFFPSIGTTERNRDEEIIKLLQADSNNDSDWTKLWYFMNKKFCFQVLSINV